MLNHPALRAFCLAFLALVVLSSSRARPTGERSFRIGQYGYAIYEVVEELK